jgi:hypothetical protein
MEDNYDTKIGMLLAEIAKAAIGNDPQRWQKIYDNAWAGLTPTERENVLDTAAKEPQRFLPDELVFFASKRMERARQEAQSERETQAQPASPLSEGARLELELFQRQSVYTQTLALMGYYAKRKQVMGLPMSVNPHMVEMLGSQEAWDTFEAAMQEWSDTNIPPRCGYESPSDPFGARLVRL